MRIVLRITSGPEAGQEVSFGPGDTRLVGRARNADVRLADDPYISDLHVGFYVDEAGVCVVRDLYSSNGTLLNDEALEEAVLKDGDRVTAGETEIEVRIEPDEVPADDLVEEAAPAAADEGGEAQEVAPYSGIPAVPIDETIVLQEPAKVAVSVAAKAAVPSWVARPGPEASPAPLVGRGVPAAVTGPVTEPVAYPVTEPVAQPVTYPVAQSAFVDVPKAPPPPAMLPRVIINLPPAVSPAAPPLGEGAASDSAGPPPLDLTRLLTALPDPLFALVDAAREKAVPRLVSDAGPDALSLYSGRRAERLASAAPYLVRLTGERIPRFVSEAWGKSSGIVFASALPIEALRAHFKRLLIVETEARDTVYFRYYDPRVLRIFLPSCSSAQARRFFGPVAWFLVEGKAGGPPERFAPPPPPSPNGAGSEPVEPDRELLGLRDEQLDLFRRDASERRPA